MLQLNVAYELVMLSSPPWIPVGTIDLAISYMPLMYHASEDHDELMKRAEASRAKPGGST